MNRGFFRGFEANLKRCDGQAQSEEPKHGTEPSEILITATAISHSSVTADRTGRQARTEDLSLR